MLYRRRSSLSAFVVLPLAALASAAGEPPRKPGTDLYGDPLPRGALARLGTVRLKHGSPVSSLAFSPDGKMIASTCRDARIYLWEAATGKHVAQLGEALPVGHGSYTAGQAVVFAPDGSSLASPANWYNGINVFHLPGGSKQVFVRENTYLTAAYVPAGKQIAELTHRGQFRIWDIATGDVRQFGREQEDVSLFGFLPDTAIALCGAKDGSVQLWNVATGKEVRRIQAHAAKVRAVAAAPDGKTLASAGDWPLSSLRPRDEEAGRLILWDAETGTPIRRFAGLGGTVRLAFSPDGKMLARGGSGGELTLLDSADGRKLFEISCGSPANDALNEALPVAFSPSGKVLAAAGTDHTIRFFDTVTFKEIVPAPAPAVTGPVTFAAEGTLISHPPHARTRFWDARTGRELDRFGMVPAAVQTVIFSADRRYLATRAQASTVVIWDTVTGKARRFEKIPENLERMAFGPGGKLFLAGPTLHTERREFKGKVFERTYRYFPIQLWDVEAGKEAGRFGHRDEDSDFTDVVALSPRASLLVVATGPSVFPASGMNLNVRKPRRTFFWDLATGREVAGFQTLKDWCDGAVFSPDGELLATNSNASADSISVWNTRRAQEIGFTQLSDGRIDAVAFSSDGRNLATGNQKGIVELWEIATGKPRRRWPGHGGPVQALSFSLDGRLLASSSTDRTGLVWDVTGIQEGGIVRPVEISARELEDLWADLGHDDGLRAYDAVWRFAAGIKESERFLKTKCPLFSPEKINRLVRDLGDERYPVRQKATKELENWGVLVVPILKKALAGQPPLEVRLRLEALLRNVSGQSERRFFLAVEALELRGTPESLALLRELAQGPPEIVLTREARAALARLGK